MNGGKKCKSIYLHTQLDSTVSENKNPNLVVPKQMGELFFSEVRNVRHIQQGFLIFFIILFFAPPRVLFFKRK